VDARATAGLETGCAFCGPALPKMGFVAAFRDAGTRVGALPGLRSLRLSTGSTRGYCRPLPPGGFEAGEPKNNRRSFDSPFATLRVAQDDNHFCLDWLSARVNSCPDTRPVLIWSASGERVGSPEKRGMRTWTSAVQRVWRPALLSCMVVSRGIMNDYFRSLPPGGLEAVE
jgi:hypothetical protein